MNWLIDEPIQLPIPTSPDPYFLNGRMTGWYTREWANMFA